ncbi:hypothetical protein [Variovorax arabinosiphilus]|uniref:hypothetical protein n=1 Tax=Variovorax arabinosiphilus TaxID=3053498 RepID=UPI002575275B|nr:MULTISPECIES: hypothetical protein [unclassified Variovorax]MDM0119397.1 hypothetical protein [Variovorax sp. J2L1-78]MDM0129823.1 hypothetical protein [Variovorax sp. J2L1-63]MDM0232391.1 hypothetical protein [Variovorax sp. J2R1-6]
MRPGHRFRFLLASSMLALLAACGGGGDDNVATTPPPTGASPNDAARQAAFATDFGAGLASLNSYGGLTNTAFLDNYDDAFLDAGYSKAQVRDALTQEAAALLLFSTQLSSFPAVKLSAVTINGCDAANVCTLTATLTNTDVDTTSVTFTSRLSFTGGKFRLLGDQKQT